MPLLTGLARPVRRQAGRYACPGHAVIAGPMAGLRPTTAVVAGPWRAAGTGGRTFVRSAGGQWSEAQRTTFNDLTDMALAGTRAVMVGLNGTILLSDDAGEKWQVVQ